MKAPRIRITSVGRRRVLRLFLGIVLLLVFIGLVYDGAQSLSRQKQSFNGMELAKQVLPMTSLSYIAPDAYPRIFCMVPTQIHTRATFPVILDLWGKWCDEIIFTVDPKQYCEPGKEDLQPEEEIEYVYSTDQSVRGKIVYLNKLVREKGNMCYAGGHGKTKCRHIWEKVWRSWVYVADHYAPNYDFFFKIDDDTFFFVPVMREVLLERGWSSNDHHYFGHRTYPTDKVRGLINGALAGFSRHTLVTLVNDVYKHMNHEYGDRSKFKHRQCVDRDGATEEVTTSICVGKLGVDPEALYDSSVLPRRPHMLLWMPRDMLTFSRRDNSSSWFYQNAPRDVGTLLECCSFRPVGFHFMRRKEDLMRVYDLIVDPNSRGKLEQVVRDKVPQWEMSQSTEKFQCSVFDGTPMLETTCAEEAKYWLKVKQVWHARHPSWYVKRLPSQ